MSTALAPLAPSLFDLEQDLLSLIETDEMAPQEKRDEFERELAVTIQKSVEKRDRVAQFLQHVCHQQENCDKEISRLKARKESFERAEKRMKMYVQRVIESLGTDAKGKPKKLEGNLATFTLRQSPGHIEITDEQKVPADLKNVELCLPLKTWEAICDLYNPGIAGRVSIDKREAKRRIEAGEDVPGVDLTVGVYCLVVK